MISQYRICSDQKAVPYMQPGHNYSTNYPVEYDKFYYSVPYKYYDQPVVIHAFAKKIEIFTDGGDRIAIHQRRFIGKRYVTIKEHMPANHQAVVEFRSYDGKFYRNKALSIGFYTGRFVDILLEGVDFEEQAYIVISLHFLIAFSIARINRMLYNPDSYSSLVKIFMSSSSGHTSYQSISSSSAIFWTFSSISNILISFIST